MTNIRIPAAVCAAVADVLIGSSHAVLDELFLASGAPGPPPDLAHHSKWKTWLQRVGNDPNADSLTVLGNLIEEFMDLSPISGDSLEFLGIKGPDPLVVYKQKRDRLAKILEEHGFRYYRGGRILPIDVKPDDPLVREKDTTPTKPSSVEDLLAILIRGLPRAMHPLIHRRKGAIPLVFESEYDIQEEVDPIDWTVDGRS